tara:strand:- start:898 stop:1314 length:417 start_codon:yes stop_codon:yes gene_type:complete
MIRILVSSLLFLLLTTFSLNAKHIAFRDYQTILDSSMIAGALYACSKNNAFNDSQKMAFQFLHFKVADMVDNYFILSYRVIAQQDASNRTRKDLVNEHLEIENKIFDEQEYGASSINNGSLTCKQVSEITDLMLQAHN